MSEPTIAEIVRELKSLSIEIKSRAGELRDLRKKKKDNEEIVMKYLEEKDQPGIKCDNFVILSEQKEKRMRKKKAEKIVDGSNVLKKYGISEPEKVLNEIIESMRGNKSVVSCLKTKDMVI